MGLEVNKIVIPVQRFSPSGKSGNGVDHVRNTTIHTSLLGTKAEAAENMNNTPIDIQIEQTLREISHISNLFNRKLKFSINRELNSVIVKVIDRETDKVIKEIPPASLQRLHARMKEAIGLLIDEEI